MHTLSADGLATIMLHSISQTLTRDIGLDVCIGQNCPNMHLTQIAPRIGSVESIGVHACPTEHVDNCTGRSRSSPMECIKDASCVAFTRPVHRQQHDAVVTTLREISWNDRVQCRIVGELEFGRSVLPSKTEHCVTGINDTDTFRRLKGEEIKGDAARGSNNCGCMGILGTVDAARAGGSTTPASIIVKISTAIAVADRTARRRPTGRRDSGATRYSHRDL